MEARRSGASARRRTLGVAASIVVHIAFLAFLALSPGVRERETPVGSIDLQLVPPIPAEAVRRGRPASTAAPARRRLAAPAAAADSGAAAAAEIPPPRTRSSEPSEPAGMARALRRSLGCANADFMQLTPEERQHCRDQFAAAASGATVMAELGVDPRKRAIFDAPGKRDRILQEPFLAERPKRGCRPQVTEQDLPVNGSAPHDWTVSIACGVPF